MIHYVPPHLPPDVEPPDVEPPAAAADEAEREEIRSGGRIIAGLVVVSWLFFAAMLYLVLA